MQNCGIGSTITGGSLGFRTGSYGSLQKQQTPNGGLRAQNYILLRKPSRMSLSGSRDKERFLPYIFRHFARRRIAMVILVITAIAFCMSVFFIVSKGFFHIFFSRVIHLFLR